MGRIASVRAHPIEKMAQYDCIDCEAFAVLLQQVYESPGENLHMDRDEIKNIRAFMMDELKSALKHMAKRRSPDKSGIVVVLIQHAGEPLLGKLLQTYNEIISSGVVPSKWHCTIFSMLPKSGDLKDASNWRPIAILPILYKVFARLLYQRIQPILEKEQSDDQYGFCEKRIATSQILYGFREN